LSALFSGDELGLKLPLAPAWPSGVFASFLYPQIAQISFPFFESVDFSQLNFSQNKKEWTIPICYDFEMDLENMSKTLKIDREEIKNIHLNSTFFIYMVGFIPGHPFMGDLDSKLFLNRLKTPRVKIPPGSVGIVEKFCNIYPYESPGGWNIIGRTPTKLFNRKDNSNPCLLSPGDSVKFKLITKKEFEELNNEQ